MTHFKTISALSAIPYLISAANENTYSCVCESGGGAEVISTGMAWWCVDRMRNRALLFELDKYLHPPHQSIHRGQHKDQNQQYISINN